MRSIGENLKKIRKTCGLTQKKLSELSGVHNVYINKIEKGVYNNPSMEVLNKLASVLHCTVDDLTEGLTEETEDKILKDKVYRENKEFLDKISKLSKEDKEVIKRMIEAFEKSHEDY